MSNVPGPRVVLYAAGGEVKTIYPVIPLAGSHALAVGVLTYGSGLHVALHADPDSLPGTEQLPRLFERALSDLEGATAKAPAQRGKASRRSGDQRRSERPALPREPSGPRRPASG